jgi:hypothetical protein
MFMRVLLYSALWLALVYVASVPHVAFGQGVGPAPGFELLDEGVTQGRIQKLNCAGAGVSCSKSGVTGTATIGGGGPGSANVVEVTVDFGTTGATKATAVVTGQAWVGAASVIVCSPTLMATADRTDGMEDAVVEGLTVSAYARSAGVGFTVAAAPRMGKAFKKFMVHCTGA